MHVPKGGKFYLIRTGYIIPYYICLLYHRTSPLYMTVFHVSGEQIIFLRLETVYVGDLCLTNHWCFGRRVISVLGIAFHCSLVNPFLYVNLFLNYAPFSYPIHYHQQPSFWTQTSFLANAVSFRILLHPNHRALSLYLITRPHSLPLERSKVIQPSSECLRTHEGNF